MPEDVGRSNEANHESDSDALVCSEVTACNIYMAWQLFGDGDSDEEASDADGDGEQECFSIAANYSGKHSTNRRSPPT